jgi:hypothetical protein
MKNEDGWKKMRHQQNMKLEQCDAKNRSSVSSGIRHYDVNGTCILIQKRVDDN